MKENNFLMIFIAITEATIIIACKAGFRGYPGTFFPATASFHPGDPVHR
jgi:hypothetical protein